MGRPCQCCDDDSCQIIHHAEQGDLNGRIVSVDGKLQLDDPATPGMFRKRYRTPWIDRKVLIGRTLPESRCQLSPPLEPSCPPLVYDPEVHDLFRCMASAQIERVDANAVGTAGSWLSGLIGVFVTTPGAGAPPTITYATVDASGAIVSTLFSATCPDPCVWISAGVSCRTIPAVEPEDTVAEVEVFGWYDFEHTEENSALLSNAAFGLSGIGAEFLSPRMYGGYARGLTAELTDKPYAGVSLSEGARFESIRVTMCQFFWTAGRTGSLVWNSSEGRYHSLSDGDSSAMVAIDLIPYAGCLPRHVGFGVSATTAVGLPNNPTAMCDELSLRFHAPRSGVSQSSVVAFTSAPMMTPPGLAGDTNATSHGMGAAIAMWSQSWGTWEVATRTGIVSLMDVSAINQRLGYGTSGPTPIALGDETLMAIVDATGPGSYTLTTSFPVAAPRPLFGGFPTIRDIGDDFDGADGWSSLIVGGAPLFSAGSIAQSFADLGGMKYTSVGPALNLDGSDPLYDDTSVWHPIHGSATNPIVAAEDGLRNRWWVIAESKCDVFTDHEEIGAKFTLDVTFFVPADYFGPGEPAEDVHGAGTVTTDDPLLVEDGPPGLWIELDFGRMTVAPGRSIEATFSQNIIDSDCDFESGTLRPFSDNGATIEVEYTRTQAPQRVDLLVAVFEELPWQPGAIPATDPLPNGCDAPYSARRRRMTIGGVVWQEAAHSHAAIAPLSTLLRVGENPPCRGFPPGIAPEWAIVNLPSTCPS